MDPVVPHLNCWTEVAFWSEYLSALFLCVNPNLGHLFVKLNDPYGQRYMGTCHGGHNGCKPLAVIPNFNHGIAVVKATELVGFVPRLPGKSLCEQPSGKAVIMNNIVVPPVGKDALSVGGTQYTLLFPSAHRGVVRDTGAEAPVKCFCCCHFDYHGLPSKGGNGENLWSVDEKTVMILVSCCLKQGRCLEHHCSQNKSWKWTLVENILNYGFQAEQGDWGQRPASWE